MKSKIVALTLLVFLIGLDAQAKQANDSLAQSKYKHYLGAAAGFTTGSGMSYRYWPCRFGVQSTLGLSVLNNSTTNYINIERRYDIGMTILFKAVHTPVMNLFVYQGNNCKYYFRETNTLRKEEYEWNNGIGVGFEFCANRISFDLMGGYGFFETFTRVGITSEVGLYYTF